jgi:hypothetical protein
VRSNDAVPPAQGPVAGTAEPSGATRAHEGVPSATVKVHRMVGSSSAAGGDETIVGAAGARRSRT